MIKNKNVEQVKRSYYNTYHRILGEPLKLSGDLFIDGLYKFIIFFPRITTILGVLMVIILDFWTISLYMPTNNGFLVPLLVFQIFGTLIGLVITVVCTAESDFGKKWYGPLGSNNYYEHDGYYYKTEYSYYQMCYLLNYNEKE
jgi:hypothetical protein